VIRTWAQWDDAVRGFVENVAALKEIAAIMPFPLLGIDSDNRSEFIDHHLPGWCEKR
jgi:hypothetical protein